MASTEDDDDRRRAERHGVDVPGRLFLGQTRQIKVRVRNIGTLGALLQIADLEEPVFEGERAVLEHPRFASGRVEQRATCSVCRIVRVELEFEEAGVARQLAVYFDGGAAPEGVKLPPELSLAADDDDGDGDEAA
jgi:hypothetical protein